MKHSYKELKVWNWCKAVNIPNQRLNAHAFDARWYILCKSNKSSQVYDESPSRCAGLLLCTEEINMGDALSK